MIKDQIDIFAVQYRIIAYPKGKQPVEFISLCSDISMSDDKGSFVSSVDITLKNIKETEHNWFHSQVKPMTPIQIQASESGGKWQGIFHGLVYKMVTNAADHTIDLTLYDYLYPLMQSEGNYYFSKGTTAKKAIETIAKDNGIPLLPIKGLGTPLPKMVCTGQIAGIIEDILEEHNKKDPSKYVVRASLDGKIEIIQEGQNKESYEITDYGVGSSSHEINVENLTTVVKIYKATEGDDKTPILKTTKEKNTQCGKIVKIIKESKSDKKNEAEKTAKELLDKKSKPKNIGRISEMPDIPWIKKGDKIHLATGTIGSFKDGKQVSKSYIVVGLKRKIHNRTMSVEVEG